MVKLSYMIIFMVHSRVCALTWMQGGYWVSSLCLIPHIFYIVLSYKLIIRYHFQCPHPNPSHCEGFCTTFSKSFASFGSNVPFLSALHSGLLTFFSSLVIQESLINCAGERRRSKKSSLLICTQNPGHIFKLSWTHGCFPV